MERPEPKFVPGELVEVSGCNFPEWNGRRGVVVYRSFLHGFSRSLDRIVDTWAYELSIGCPTDAWSEHNLKSPPKDEPTTFDASIWQPKEVNA